MNDTTRVTHWRAFEAEALADAIDATLAEPPALATVSHLNQPVHEIEPLAAESRS
jgi:hypothetical protein